MTDEERRLAEEEMRFGPREYTGEMAAFIRETVKNRRQLPEQPLPIEE